MRDGLVAAPTPEQAFGFDEFWKDYPLQQNKLGALKVWKRNRLGDQLPAILEGLKRYLTSKAVHDRCVMDPAKWLSGERWTDHHLQPAATTSALMTSAARLHQHVFNKREQGSGGGRNIWDICKHEPMCLGIIAHETLEVRERAERAASALRAV